MTQGENNSSKLFVHIVTYNDLSTVAIAIRSLLHQEGYIADQNLLIEVTDNASDNSSTEWQLEFSDKPVRFYRNEFNLGFCGAHNQAIKRFLESDADYFLFLNPDVSLEPNALKVLSESFDETSRTGLYSIKLLRADDDLRPLEPKKVDAAGMYFEDSWRHLDRGSGQLDKGDFDKNGYVIGGTGAALCVSRKCVEELLLPLEAEDSKLYRVYPQLLNDKESRVQFLDEAYFAYREDAELALRANRLGWSCKYVAQAVGFHKRVVVPERRSELPANVNSWSVRNRFLMQLVHFTPSLGLRVTLKGVLLRNLLVFFAVTVSLQPLWTLGSLDLPD